MSREDIVITPRLAGIKATAPVDAKRERQLGLLSDRRGSRLYSRLRKAVIARRLSRARQVSAARRVRLSARAGTAVRSTGALGRAAARAGRVPVGLFLVAGAAAATVATRIGTGRSFGNLGANLKENLLGDLADRAAAQKIARESILSDPDIAGIIGREGSVNSQIATLYEAERDLAFKTLRGRSLFEIDPEFQSNNNLDLIILRGRDLIADSFNANGGADAVKRLDEALTARGIK